MFRRIRSVFFGISEEIMRILVDILFILRHIVVGDLNQITNQLNQIDGRINKMANEIEVKLVEIETEVSALRVSVDGAVLVIGDLITELEACREEGQGEVTPERLDAIVSALKGIEADLGSAILDGQAALSPMVGSGGEPATETGTGGNFGGDFGSD